MDLALVQPPLPVGKGENSRILAGTEDEGWCKVEPAEWSKKCRVGWWDLKQEGDGDGEGQALLGGEGEGGEGEGGEGEGEDGERFENWWPGNGRWHLGVMMEDATIEFPVGERWL